VAPGIACVPSAELPRAAAAHEGYVVVGAGKTGMDACLWLLESGAAPESIRWVVPRDYWWLNRATYQPGEAHFPRVAQSIANLVQALAEGATLDDVFARLEAFDEVRRLDPTVAATGFHGGFVSERELEQLRRIRQVVRLGRVRRIGADRIDLERGSVPTGPRFLHVDCSAIGIPVRPSKPIFDGQRITPQWVRISQPTLSWAAVGHIEATRADDAEKNRLCRPITPPDTPRDWVRMMATDLGTQLLWSKDPGLREWQFQSRLDPFTRRVRSTQPTDAEVVPHLQRYAKFVAPAAQNAARLMAG
jgi:hypothetical protein